MGLEARCTGRHGRDAGEGRLQLEGERLLFRGDFRLDVAVKDLKKATASGDELILSWGRETAAFALGAAAVAKWVHKILHPPSLLDKLGIKAEQAVATKGKFDAAFLAELETRVKAGPVRAGKEYDVVLLLIAEGPAGLDAVAPLIPRLTQAGALWIVYPKGGAVIKEAQVREAGLAAGLVDNKTCAFSAVLTALRWVRPRALRSA